MTKIRNNGIQKTGHALGMSSTIDRFLWPNRYMLTFLGYWPLESDVSFASLLFAHFRIFMSLVGVLFYLIPEIIMIIIYWGDIVLLTGLGGVAASLGKHTFKVFYLYARRQNFYGTYVMIRELWSQTTNEYEREVLEKVANQAKCVSVAFFFACFGNNISFTASSIIGWIRYNAQGNKSLYARHLPFDVWLGIDLEETPNFEIAFGFEQIASLFCCVSIVAVNSSMMTLILHVCGHFRTIRVRICAIGREMNDNAELVDFNYDLMKSRAAIVDCIKRHLFMISFAEEVRSLLSPVMFVQLLSSGLEICLSGYAAMMHSSSAGDLIKFTIYFVSLFAELMIWCWPGQLLIQDSIAISESVYHDLPWHLMTPSQQRDLGFVIIRAQKECQITALNFQVMSLRKLTEVFNTAGSYLALLRNLYEKQINHF